MAGLATIDMVSDMRERLMIKIKVKRMREFKVRMWLTLALLRMAAWVAPATIDVETDEPA